MPPFKLEIKKSVEKDLRQLPAELLDRILEKIEALKIEPFPTQSIKLSGVENYHRLRVGDYRVVYRVEKHVITIYHVRHRREVYRSV